MKKGQFVILIAVIVLCAGGIFGYVKYESRKEKCQTSTNEEEKDYTKTTAYTDFTNKYNQKLESLKDSFVNNSNSTDSYFNLKEAEKVDCNKYSDGYYKDYNDCYYATGADRDNSTNTMYGYFILAKNKVKNNIASWSIRYYNKLDELGYNGDLSVYDTYNVNLETGKELSSSELLSLFNISTERFNKIVKDYYINDMNKYFYSVSDNEGLGSGYNNIKNETVDHQFNMLHELWENLEKEKRAINSTNYKPNDYKIFINDDGYLSVIMNPIYDDICVGASYCEGYSGLEIIEIN